MSENNGLLIHAKSNPDNVQCCMNSSWFSLGLHCPFYKASVKENRIGRGEKKKQTIFVFEDKCIKLTYLGVPCQHLGILEKALLLVAHWETEQQFLRTKQCPSRQVERRNTWQWARKKTTKIPLHYLAHSDSESYLRRKPIPWIKKKMKQQK